MHWQESREGVRRAGPGFRAGAVAASRRALILSAGSAAVFVAAVAFRGAGPRGAGDAIPRSAFPSTVLPTREASPSSARPSIWTRTSPTGPACGCASAWTRSAPACISCIRCHPQGASNSRTFVNGSLLRGTETHRCRRRRVLEGELLHRDDGNGVGHEIADRANTTIAGGYSFLVEPAGAAPHQRRRATGRGSLRLGHADAGPAHHRAVRLRTWRGERLSGEPVPSCRRRWRAHGRRHARPARPSDPDGASPPSATGQYVFEADYRRYSDDWDVRGNTFSVGLSHYVTPQVLVNGTYRRYGQSGAYFYAPSYTGTPGKYFTADFRLFPFDSNLYTGGIVLTPAEGLLGMPRGTGLTLQYDFYRRDDRLPGRHLHDRCADPAETAMTLQWPIGWLVAALVIATAIGGEARQDRRQPEPIVS